jgi:hypothetical protein
MMIRSNRLRRAALLLALLVLAGIVTGVAASATNTAIPKQMTGRWGRHGWAMRVYSSGEVLFERGLDDGEAEFSRVTAHQHHGRLSIGGILSCSGPGIYRWAVANHQLKFIKIHDACKARVSRLSGTWSRPN